MLYGWEIVRWIRRFGGTIHEQDIKRRSLIGLMDRHLTGGCFALRGFLIKLHDAMLISK
jgi:hypothetical protein